jgi:ribosome-binding protein aMBF1 (putative translation factor)
VKDDVSDAATIMDIEFGREAGYEDLLLEERVSSSVAKAIYDARAAAGLTQKELADLVGTRQSVISRLEDADYGRQSLAMLQRIASALHHRVEVRFVPRASGIAA